MEATETLDRQLADALRAHGHRVTTQRLLLHRHLAEREQHATAEQTHRAVADRLPNVSVQTIYATLELFEQLGIVRRVASPTGATLFDSRVAPHHHRVCRSCGAVADVDADVDCAPALAAARAAGFAPDAASVTVLGVCERCAAVAR